MAIINTSKTTYKPTPVKKPTTTAYIPKPTYTPPKTSTPVKKPPTTTAKPATSVTSSRPPVKTTPTKPPAISSSTAAEIKRKAQAGIPMDSPTPEKLALYNQYKPSTPKAPAGKMANIYAPTHKPTTPSKPVSTPKPTPVSPKAPAGKMAGIYDGIHKPVAPPKPVYKPSPSLKAPTGKMNDIYRDMHKPVAPPKPSTPSKPTSTYKPTSSYKPTSAAKPSYSTVTIPKPSTPTPTKPAPVTAKPAPVTPKPVTPQPSAPSNPSQPGWGPSPYVPKPRDENGTVGPTDNGHNNWNSNQSIPDYGGMTPDMIQDMVANLTNGGKQYDPATDAVYQSMLQLANKQADAAGLSAMEDMNERGILNSTVTADRMGQIKQGASDSVLGAVPGLQANYLNQQNNNQQNYQALLNSVMGGAEWQQEFAEGNRRFDKGYQLDEADVTGVYTPAEAIAKGYNVGAGIQTLEAQGQYADQNLAKDKLTFERDAFGQEIALKNREQTFQEQNALIKADLESRGLDLEEVKIGIDRFAAESDADYKQRQIDFDVTDHEAKTNTNKAIGQILSASSMAEGFGFINANTNAWATSGVDFKSVINALESKFPGSKEQLESSGGTSDYFGTP